jgi:glutamate carboxypeptidase
MFKFRPALFTLLAFALPLQAADTIPAQWKGLLTELVNTNSGTGNAKGAEKIRRRLKKEFHAFGFEQKIFEGADGHQVVSYEQANAKPTLLWFGHIDTVFAQDSKFQRLRQEGDHLIGPGVIDMKGGIVLMLHLLSELSESNNRNQLKKIRIVLVDDEETLSKASRSIADELATGIPYGLIFEPGAPGGYLVTSHSGSCWVELSIHGRAAHAGLAHQDGVNACVELGDEIARISKLTDYPRRLTLSPDLIHGGTKTNIVCEDASAQIDIRFNAKSDLDGTLQKIDEIRKNSFVHNEKLNLSPSSSVQQLALFMNLSESSTNELFTLAKNAGSEIGQEVRGEHVGYSTDAGHLAATGMKVLVGLGPYGDGLHTEREYMDIKSYNERLRLNLSLISKILNTQ